MGCSDQPPRDLSFTSESTQAGAAEWYRNSHARGASRPNAGSSRFTASISSTPSRSFSFIGANPHTAWLPAELTTDAKGFVCTGATPTRPQGWDRRRAPFLLETSRPGAFTAGDVRAGSIKRVASAVGEGAMTVKLVHEVLKEM